MPLPAWVIPGIGAASNIATNLINAGSQRRENTRQRQFTMDMYQRQRNDALSDWRMNNEYNDPKAMMARLRAAGLNPNLAYGNPTTAGVSTMPRSSSGQGYNSKAPQIETSGINDAIMMFYDIQKTQAQTDNIKAQAELAKLRQGMIDEQIAKLVADIAGTQAQTQGQELSNKRESFLQDRGYYAYKTDNEWQQVRKNTAGADMAELERDVKNLLKENTVEQALVKLATMRNVNEAVKVKIDNMIKEGKLKDFEMKLAEYGLTKGDPGWIRAFITLFDKL